jgi:2-polyprenyl-3-methyl-5-hydroxy-6-metoxy-1,4-benzoquinol methylase
MANIVDERGYNQVFRPTQAQAIRLHRRAEAIVGEMTLPATLEMRDRISILELGCGTGELAYHLAMLTGARVKGVDLSQQFIDHAQTTYQHENLTFIVADLSRTSPRSESEKYDYIVGNGILHHLYHHLHTFLPALKRWLAPGGRLIFWEPNLVNPYIYLIFSIPALRRLAKLEPDEMAFTSGFVRQKLTQAGFTRVKTVTRDFLLPNTPGFLVGGVITAGRILEKIPVVRNLAQSIFFSAQV